MQLIRNTSKDGRGKYAIIDNRTGKIIEARAGDAEEFFVLKLKDVFAAAALRAYADAAAAADPEYAAQVRELADRSEQHPLRKRPD